MPQIDSDDYPNTSPAEIPPRPLRHTLLFGPDGLRAGWSLLLFALLVALLLVPTLSLVRHQTARVAAEHRSPEHGVGSVLAQDGLFFLLLLVSSFAMSRIERRPLAAYGLGATPRAGRQIAGGLAWGLVLLSLLVLLLRSAHLLVFSGHLLHPSAAIHFGLLWSAGFLAVGLFEEYFLRGFLLFTLARGLAGIFGSGLGWPRSHALGFWTAATLLAFVFGLGHRANPGESPLGLFSAGAAALVFSYSLWRTGSLWWAIGFHAAWDWAQSFLYGVADSGTMVSHHLFTTHPAGAPLLSGGLTGPEGSLFVLPVLLLAAVVIHLTLRPPPRRVVITPTSSPDLL